VQPLALELVSALVSVLPSAQIGLDQGILLAVISLSLSRDFQKTTPRRLAGPPNLGYVALFTPFLEGQGGIWGPKASVLTSRPFTSKMTRRSLLPEVSLMKVIAMKGSPREKLEYGHIQFEQHELD